MDGRVIVLAFRLGFLRGAGEDGVDIVSDIGW